MIRGDRIHNLRIEKGLTLETLGKRIGVSKATIKRYENGIIANIPSDKIEALAEALETTPEFLMGWDEIPEEPKPEPPRTLEARIVSYGLDHLSEEDRQKILHVVQAMFINNPDFFMNEKGDSEDET